MRYPPIIYDIWNFRVCEKAKLSAFPAKKKSIRLKFWTREKRIARVLEHPMRGLHTICDTCISGLPTFLHFGNIDVQKCRTIANSISELPTVLHFGNIDVQKCRTVSIFRKKNPYGLHSGHTTSVSLDSWSSRCTICILFTAFLWIRELAPKKPKKV